jgi:hypothetical protein
MYMEKRQMSWSAAEFVDDNCNVNAGKAAIWDTFNTRK